MSSIQTALHELGLSQLEQNIYTSLLDRSYTHISDIAQQHGISRQTLYNRIQHLSQNGFLERHHNQWYAVRPSVILSRLELKSFQLNQHKAKFAQEIEDWEYRWRTTQTKDHSRIHRGEQAIREMYEKILSSKHPIYSIGNVEGLFEDLGISYIKNWIQRRVHSFQSHGIFQKSTIVKKLLKEEFKSQAKPDIQLVDFEHPTRSVMSVYNDKSVMIFNTSTQEVIEIDDADFTNLVKNIFSLIQKD